MPRRSRRGFGGLVFHVFNRAARQLPLFATPQDFAAFERVLAEAGERVPMRVLCYCVMPNHWHLVLWPRGDNDLSRYVAWLTMTHARRWRDARGTTGGGAVYQGRFQAVPVQEDGHLLTVCRYVERNPVRAGLVRRVEDWPWSSRGRLSEKCTWPALHPWPVPQPVDWTEHVNRAEPGQQLDALRQRVRHRAPFGTDDWAARVAQQLGLDWPKCGPGRPRKPADGPTRRIGTGLRWM